MHTQRFSFGKRAAEDDERGIGGAEEVEEEPGGEEGEEEEEGEGIGEERDGEDGGEAGEVVDAEVGVVLADAECGFGEGFGLGEGGAVDELRPGAAVGEAGADRVGYVGDEGAEGWGGDWWLGFGCGGLGGCEWEDGG